MRRRSVCPSPRLYSGVSRVRKLEFNFTPEPRPFFRVKEEEEDDEEEEEEDDDDDDVLNDDEEEEGA